VKSATGLKYSRKWREEENGRKCLVPYIFHDMKSMFCFIDKHNLLREEYLLFLI